MEILLVTKFGLPWNEANEANEVEFKSWIQILAESENRQLDTVLSLLGLWLNNI